MPLLHPHDMKRAWLRRRAKAKAKTMIRKTCPAPGTAGLRRLAPPQHARRDEAVTPEPETPADELDGVADRVAYPSAC